MLEKVITQPNIYEFDLEKFFDRVKVGYAMSVLSTTGLPEKTMTFFKKLSLSVPRLDGPENKEEKWEHLVDRRGRPNVNHQERTNDELMTEEAFQE